MVCEGKLCGMHGEKVTYCSRSYRSENTPSAGVGNKGRAGGRKRGKGGGGELGRERNRLLIFQLVLMVLSVTGIEDRTIL